MNENRREEFLVVASRNIFGNAFKINIVSFNKHFAKFNFLFVGERANEFVYGPVIYDGSIE